MGDIRRIRKKYQKPGHPWNKERIESERVLVKTYGLRNKKELWKAETILKNIKDQIKQFPSLTADKAKLQSEKLRKRLLRLGFIKEDTPLSDVLGFSTEVVLNRRLQTMVFKKGLARTPLQARQLVIHEHIVVGDKKINAPGYLVSVDEESQITFDVKSSFFSADHPERVVVKKEKKGKEVKSSDDLDVEVVQLTEEDEQIE